MMLEHASYLLSETLLADGLGNIAVEAHVKTALLIPLHGVCGHGDGGLSRFCPGAFLLTKQANGGLAVHLGHLKIDQQNVPLARAPAFKQRDAVVDDLTGMAEAFQQARGNFLINEVIFSQQDPQPRRRPGRYGAATGAGAVSPTVFGARSNAAAIA